MNSGWTNGIISGFNEIRSGIQYFVSTPYGIAVMFPRVHENIRGFEVGSYVRVITAPSQSDSSKNEVVQSVEWNEQPEDHEVDIKWNRITVKCNAYFAGQENGWFIFDNEYLGRLGMKENGGMHERAVRVDCPYRLLLRRSKPEDGLPSICDSVVWIVEDINFADRDIHTGRWFEGVVTKQTDTYVLVTSPGLPTDAFIFDWRKGDMIVPEDILGRWIRFQVDIRRANDHGLRYRAAENFTVIDSLYKTRVISGLTEMFVRCKWNGEMEDSKALLYSEIGPIRDYDGILDTMNEDTKGDYEYWVVKHFRQNHSARWKISIYDNKPLKINEHIPRESLRAEKCDFEVSEKLKESSLGTSKKPIKDGRILDLMLHLMKRDSVRESFIDNDIESAIKIKAILDRYAEKKYFYE